MRARLKNTTLRPAVALLVVLACLGLAACGGSSNSPQALLSDTFSGNTPIESGQVNLSFAISGTGGKGTTKPLAVNLTGPFQSEGAGKLPRFSLKLDLGAAGHTLSAGATSTGSALYVELGGTWFSTPQSTYQAIAKGYAQATSSNSTTKVHSTFSTLGIEPGKWLSDPTNAGETTIQGDPTIHLTASVNIPAFLADVSKLSQASAALGVGSVIPGGGAGSLSPAIAGELAKSIKSAHVDVYTGKDDHLLRRLEVTATLTATPQTEAILGGLKTAAVKVTLEFANLNQSQTISAPPNPQSASQLLPALQQLLGAVQGVQTEGL
ncbi:MAG TPA: hypothetical protein VGI26_02140 [Solirubrobacteraceae bacterium]